MALHISKQQALRRKGGINIAVSFTQELQAKELEIINSLIRRTAREQIHLYMVWSVL
jgi:hypothetical protein